MIPIYAQSDLFDCQENFSDGDANRALIWVLKLGPNYDFDAERAALVGAKDDDDERDGTLVRTRFFTAGSWTENFDEAARKFVDRVFGK